MNFCFFISHMVSGALFQRPKGIENTTASRLQCLECTLWGGVGRGFPQRSERPTSIHERQKGTEFLRGEGISSSSLAQGQCHTGSGEWQRGAWRIPPPPPCEAAKTAKAPSQPEDCSESGYMPFLMGFPSTL